MMDYRGILIPADIEEYIQDATPEDKRRLLIEGALRTSGVYQRTHTTHLNMGLTVFRWACDANQDSQTIKDLISEWLIAHYGITEVKFYQDQHEQRISTTDRRYFHCRATHKK